jgi:hypothetical protein
MFCSSILIQSKFSKDTSTGLLLDQNRNPVFISDVTEESSPELTLRTEFGTPNTVFQHASKERALLFLKRIGEHHREFSVLQEEIFYDFLSYELLSCFHFPDCNDSRTALQRLKAS